MITYLLLDFGNPTIMSIAISIHIINGMGKGCSYPRGFIASPFFLLANDTLDHKGVDVLLHAFPKK
jgi:hypothetical protein